MAPANTNEKMIKRQKQELLKYGAQDLEDEDDAWGELQEAEEDPVKEEDDSWDNGDLTYITAILESFSGPKSNSKLPSASNYALFPPEGAQTRAQARPTKPPKFNQNFNQKPTIFNYDERNFSCFSNFEEEGTTELADYFSNEEDVWKIVWTTRTSQKVRASPGASQTSRNLKEFHTRDTSGANLKQTNPD
jgi:hypothetical protein